MNGDFDKRIYDLLNEKAAISPERNIGDSAIEEVLKKRECKSPTKSVRLSLRIAATAVCALVFTFIGMMTYSEDMRSAASNIVQSIFTLDRHGDSYEIVQKDANDDISTTNFGGIPTEELSKEELSGKLGFYPFMPDKIGRYKKVLSGLGLSLNGKTSELNELDINELKQILMNYPNDQRLEKFNALPRFSILFSKNGEILDDFVLYIHISKPPKKQFRDDSRFVEKISKFTYKGVECTYNATVMPEYEVNFQEGSASDCNTKRPKGYIKIKNIHFNLDGLDFSVGYNLKGTSSEEFDYDVVREFVEDFIDSYRAK